MIVAIIVTSSIITFIGFALVAVALGRHTEDETRSEILRRLYPATEIEISELAQALGRGHHHQFDVVISAMVEQGLIAYGLLPGGRMSVRLTRAGRGVAVERQRP